MDNWYDNGGVLKTVDLDWQKFGARHSIPRGVETRYSQVVDEARDALIIELNAYVLGKRLPTKEITKQETVIMDFPASPWQFFKDKHSNAWWLRWFVNRWPVLFNEFKEDVEMTAVWEQMEIYPENTINAQLGKPIRIIQSPQLQWTPNSTSQYGGKL